MTDKKKAVTEKKTRPSRRGKTLSTTEKAEAIAMWRAGTVTLDQLADRFHRDRTTFVRLFNSAGVTKGDLKEEHTKKVSEAVESASLLDAVTQANRIRETKESHYKTIEAIGKANTNIIIKATKENRSIGTSLNDLKAIQIAAQTNRIVREEKYALLGLNEEKHNDDTPLPDLIVKELTAEEIKSMHTAQLDDDDGLGQALDMDAEAEIFGELQ